MSKDAWRRYSPGGAWAYSVEDEGLKANLSDIHAAVGRGHLPHLRAWQDRRRALADRYDALLADGARHRPTAPAVHRQPRLASLRGAGGTGVRACPATRWQRVSRQPECRRRCTSFPFTGSRTSVPAWGRPPAAASPKRTSPTPGCSRCPCTPPDRRGRGLRRRPAVRTPFPPCCLSLIQRRRRRPRVRQSPGPRSSRACPDARSSGPWWSGAGHAGRSLVRALKETHDYGLQPIGFLDDDAGKRVGLRTAGLRPARVAAGRRLAHPRARSCSSRSRSCQSRRCAGSATWPRPPAPPCVTCRRSWQRCERDARASDLRSVVPRSRCWAAASATSGRTKDARSWPASGSW